LLGQAEAKGLLRDPAAFDFVAIRP
jgi:hypothetical protein